MHWTIIAVGKPALTFAREAVALYSGRVNRFRRLELIYLPASNPESEGEQLLRRSGGHFRVLLDERGESLSSRAFADRVARWEQDRIKKVSFLVGGAAGHGATLRDAADWTWSLSSLTLQHELALAVILEQLYRACTINAGTPYHRD